MIGREGRGSRGRKEGREGREGGRKGKNEKREGGMKEGGKEERNLRTLILAAGDPRGALARSFRACNSV